MTHDLGWAWAWVGLSAAGTCVGNLLLKQSHLAVAEAGFGAIAISPWFVGAIACYIFDLLLFTQALQQLPVSAAVPVVSGLRIGATARLAHAFLGEQLTVQQIAASGVITVGIVVMARA